MARQSGMRTVIEPVQQAMSGNDDGQKVEAMTE